MLTKRLKAGLNYCIRRLDGIRYNAKLIIYSIENSGRVRKWLYSHHLIYRHPIYRVIRLTGDKTFPMNHCFLAKFIIRFSVLFDLPCINRFSDV